VEEEMYQKMNPARIRYFLVIGLLALVVTGGCTTIRSAAAAPPAAVPMEVTIFEPADTSQFDGVQAHTINQNDLNYPAFRTLATNNTTARAVSGNLSDAEQEDLIFMREEEKLARDVYLTLYDQWGLRIFQNIAASEQNHTDSIKSLLDRYGLADPATGNDMGEFANPDLQALYDQLTADGSQSVVAALRVGAVIEEIDILDLLEAIAHTDRADIIRVYGNLARGSENHLRAFVSTLERQSGEIYQPQYLDQEAYEAIINSSPDNGGGKGGGNGWGNANSGGNGNRIGNGRGVRRGNGNAGRRGSGVVNMGA
jgi:hypothetical protein